MEYDTHVDFHCALLYRIVDCMDVSRSGGHDFSEGKPEAGRGKWCRIFDMGLEEMPPGRDWRCIHKLDWGLSERDAGRIHKTLFGEETLSPGNQISKIDTIRLLLAVVGVPFNVATHEDGRDSLNYQATPRVPWRFGSEDWIGVHIRKACGSPLAWDAGYNRSRRK